MTVHQVVDMTLALFYEFWACWLKILDHSSGAASMGRTKILVLNYL
jgi:hypothetical protein